MADKYAKLEQDFGLVTKKLETCEETRRRLHNTVQELRGNVRVLARIRPFLTHEASEKGEKHYLSVCAYLK